jgi:antitoxin component of MazEF toxin-antitoxin module
MGGLIMTKLCKWGNSYAVRIPQELIHRLILTEGDELSLELIGDSLKLSKAITAKSRLKLLMQQINQTVEIDNPSSSVGLEEW